MKRLWAVIVDRATRTNRRERPIATMVALAMVVVGASIVITSGGTFALADLAGEFAAEMWGVLSILGGALTLLGFGDPDPVRGVLFEMSGKFLGGVVWVAYSIAITVESGWRAGQAVVCLTAAVGLALLIRSGQLYHAWIAEVRRHGRGRR